MSKSKHTEAQIIAVLKQVEADLTGGQSWPARFLCRLPRRGWESGGVLAGGYLLRGAATSVVHLEGPFKTNRALLGSGAVL